ncbi:hypothetical protein P8845_06395 [Bacillus spizizenii]|nr:hypothetical protein [Bacillus spizizenii]MCY8166581.1 hypothetical protein [Bacillus spizizenii]MCY8189744.1 hypothetical protein [Bacillus spizizenii]MCY8226964.1 hypothetical protein [Bacillus spizizenii]MCY8394175.1 hypothetical protein [Bacillus spizizenii]
MNIFLLIITMINLIISISIISFFSKLFKVVLSHDGLPLGQKIPVDLREFTFNNKYTGFLCLDVNCKSCQSILSDLFNKENEFDLKLVYLSPEKETLRFLDTNNFALEKYQYSFKTMEDFYLKSKPFLFIINSEGIVMDKKLITNIKTLKKII